MVGFANSFVFEFTGSDASPTSIDYHGLLQDLVVANDNPQLGDLLGKGSFAHVYQMEVSETVNAALRPQLIHDTPTDTQPHFFAVKCLLPPQKKKRKYANNVQDLLNEAHLLATLPRHDNLVQLHGISPSLLQQNHSKNHFLVLDKLDESLKERLATLALRQILHTDTKLGFFGRNRQCRDQQWHRLSTLGLDVARGLAHLHQHNILYRDLKLDNVGITASGTAVLLDFGIARACPHYKATEIYKRKTHGGTPRYMAPEVLLRKCTGFPSDVYSFGIVLYEIVTLIRAFDGLTDLDKFKRLVSWGGLRPCLQLVHTSRVKKLLRRLWHAIPHQRPTMAQVVQKLATISTNVL